MAKGGEYERNLCKEFSLWWTECKRDDVFWRTSQSGGRATIRSDRGRVTYGQHGDISATDPIGEPLIDLLTIEIKRGYSNHTFANLMDHPKTAGQQKWEEFHQQTYEAWQASGSFAWMIIHKRDHRNPIVALPRFLVDEFHTEGVFVGIRAPFAFFDCDIRHIDRDKDRRIIDQRIVKESLVITTLAHWFKFFTPEMIRKIARRV